MANERGKKFKNKGSSNPWSISRIIEKGSENKKKQKASGINSNSLFVPTIAPTYDFAPAYPNVLAFASALAPDASCSWAAAQGETVACGDQLSGYIFMCNGKTKADCYKYRVFGLPEARLEVVKKIKPQMKLFLFDFDLKLLYGIYIAASNGKCGIEPIAFGGKFSAQVRFEIFKDCLPLPESAFKHVIKDNYQGGSKFRQELSDKQVTDLISLYRPIAVPPRLAVASLMPNAVPATKIVLPGTEVLAGPAAELSASYDRYLAGLPLTHAGPAHDSQHVQQAAPPFPHVAYASAANMACMQPSVQSMHLLPVGPQPQHDPYYPAEAHQAYVPENLASPPQNPYKRYTAVPGDGERGVVLQLGTTNDYYSHNMVLATTNAPVEAHVLMPLQFSTPLHGHAHLPTSFLTAAYWTAMASEDAKQVYSAPHQRMPSGSTVLGGKSLPVPFAGAAPIQPAVPENSEREIVLQSGIVNDYNHNLAQAATNPPVQAHAIVPLQLQATPSQVAGYWTAVASEDPRQVYFVPYQGLSSESTGLGAENVPVSFAGSASSYNAVPVSSGKENFPQSGTANDFYHSQSTFSH